MKIETFMLMCWQRATIFMLEMLLMRCVCIRLGESAGLFFCHRCIISHYSLTHTLAAFLPPSLHPSSSAFLYPSLPPSLSRWPLPACLSQGKLPQLRNAVLLHCYVPLCSASLHPYSTYIWTRTNTHTYCRHTQVSIHTSAHTHTHKKHWQIHIETVQPFPHP